MFGDKKNKIKDTERSLISETVSIEGTINSSGAIDVAGLVKGPVISKEVVIRETGSITLDLCNVGCGKYDGLFFANPCHNHILISSLISKETGGIINTLEYKESSIYISSNKYIGKLLKEVIKNENENEKN